MLKIIDVEGQMWHVNLNQITHFGKDPRRPDLTLITLACGTKIRSKMKSEELSNEVANDKAEVL